MDKKEPLAKELMGKTYLCVDEQVSDVVVLRGEETFMFSLPVTTDKPCNCICHPEAIHDLS